MGTKGTKYRVLSLDGGGSWALIEVKALMQLFPAGAATKGHEVLREFDLVTANSGGSIVLGCLIADFALGEILNFFLSEKQRRAVFSKTSNVGYQMLEEVAGTGPKYSAAKKLPALRKVLKETGDKQLCDAVSGVAGQSGEDVRVVIVGFDYDRLRARFFRSQEMSSKASGTGVATELTLAEAIHASSNAPVNYFDAPATYPGRPERYWDGGITGCNNPVLIGVTEAIAATRGEMEIVALSIGTATVALPWPQPGEESSPYVRPPSPDGLLNDVEKLASAILDDPPDMASFVAHVLTHSGEGLPPHGPADSRIVRMNPMVRPVRGADGKWTAPGDLGLGGFQKLANMEMDAIEPDEVEAIEHYAELWLAADNNLNQPVRMDGDTLECEVGQASFIAAKAAWEAIRG